MESALKKHKGHPIHTVVITGGPCGGKTTCFPRLKALLEEKGFRVFTTTEAATFFFQNGITFDDLADDDTRLAFQQTVISFQMNLEEGFRRVAETTGKPCVIICDRGVIDGSAYMSRELWLKLIKTLDLDEAALVARYDCVLHLVTAADGAEKFYTLENNATRTEGVEEAKAQDQKTLEAWKGSGIRCHHVITNRGTEGEEKSFEAIHLLTLT